MRLSLPESLTPGVYEVLFGGREYKEVGGTVGGLAAVASRVTVISLYDGVYPSFSIIANDIGLGEKTNITATIENFGTDTINGAYVNFEIYDPEDNLITTLKSNNVIVPSKKETLNPVIAYATFDSSKFEIRPGFYKVLATLNYDGKVSSEKKEATFRIGTLNVFIKDWTNKIYHNVTNKFIIRIESDWSGLINDVYAKIYTPDGTLKTPNLDLNKFQSANLESYWEVKKTGLGNQTITIEVFYSGTSVKKDVIVEVVPPIGPGVEKPSNIYSLNILIIVLLILIISNIYFFVLRNKKKDNQQINPPVK
ncbi:MAG: hypothetical protein KatS3mg002_1508 [Candidatus Woesearchaeota archaeon]|nr:MAG: hypothetical protein KatS3mg002_1508 [Candidatus Woesearchaeota archaeon]